MKTTLWPFRRFNINDRRIPYKIHMAIPRYYFHGFDLSSMYWEFPTECIIEFDLNKVPIKRNLKLVISNEYLRDYYIDV